MASEAFSARLRHLNDSALALALAAPTTAANLGAEFDRLARENRLEVTDLHRRQICASCGNVLAPGRSCTISVEPRLSLARQASKKHFSKARASKRTEAPAHYASKIMVYTCRRCSRKTRLNLPDTRSLLRKRKGQKLHTNSTQTPDHKMLSVASSANENIPSVSMTETKPISTNAGSKQRAKARKQSGLSAMLAKGKVDSTSHGSGNLNLMDFMKLD